VLGLKIRVRHYALDDAPKWAIILIQKVASRRARKSVYVPVDRALATHQIDMEWREAIRAARRQAARDRSIVAAAQRALREAVVQELASAGYHL
jgi:hypothetical protein